MNKPVLNISEYKTMGIGFHLGNMMRLVAGQYPTLHAMTLEVIQNMVDANVKEGYIEVDLIKNTFVSTDNGLGITQETFERVIGKIGQTIKPSDKYGQFGLAIASGYDKAQSYRIISGPKKDKGRPGWEGYTEYSFDELISDPNHAIGVVATRRNDLNASPKSWNTRIELKGLTKDKAISYIDHSTLISDAGVQFGVKINELGSKITVKVIDRKGVEHVGIIEPLTFNGRRMEQFNYHGKDCGKVYIRPYVCEKRSKTGMLVKVDGKPFRKEWSKISSAAGILVSAETQEILLSGHLEGEIIVERCEWQEKRDALKQNDALLDFLVLIEIWAKKHGAKMIDEVRTSEKSQFYQKIGLKVLSMLEPLRRAVPDFMDRGLTQFVGRVSISHTGPLDGKPDHYVRSLESEPRNKSTDSPDRVTKPRGELKDKIHTGVVNGSGSKRIIVKGQIGIALSFDEMPGSGDRYEIEPEIGLIRVNIRHQDFSDVEGSDVKLTKYLHLLLLSAISLASVPHHQRQMAKLYESTFLPLQIVDIVGKKKRSKV